MCVRVCVCARAPSPFFSFLSLSLSHPSIHPRNPPQCNPRPQLSPGEEIVFVGGYALHAKDGKRLWALPNSGPEANVTGACVCAIFLALFFLSLACGKVEKG